MSKAKNHVTRGLKIHSSEQAARKVVALVKKSLGDKYPAFFDTDIGKAIEAPLVCTAVHELVKKYDFPGRDKIEKISGFALEGCIGDVAALVSMYFMPLVGDLGGLALLFVDDTADDDDED